MLSYHLSRLRQQLLRSTGHPATFARFSLAAVCASVVDIGVLYALNLGLGLNVYLGRLLSFSVATALAYGVNRRFTFREVTNPSARLSRLVRFLGVFGIGALLNYLVFVSVVMLGNATGIVPALTAWLPVIGVWIGGLAGMCFNYVFSSRLVFRTR